MSDVVVLVARKATQTVQTVRISETTQSADGPIAMLSQLQPRISVRFPPNLSIKLNETCEKLGINTSKFVRMCVEDGLEDVNRIAALFSALDKRSK